MGARVQARLLHHFTDGTPLTILVATSGDTGSAVAQAFHRVPDTRVVVLYPEGQVSDVQEAQMASLGDNVTALAMRGTFDDCQRLVKQAFADDDLRTHVWLTPANSINLGRLLPQVFYYFVLARLANGGPVVSVPSGNFGNLTAGLIAKRIGLPVRSSLPPPMSTTRCPSISGPAITSRERRIRTVANAMDVGAPSNLERVQALYGGDIRGDPRATSRAAPTRMRRSWRRLAACIAVTATCWIRTARSPGWPCRMRSRASRTRTACSWRRRTRASSARSWSRRSGAGAAAASAPGGAGAAPAFDSMPADYADAARIRFLQRRARLYGAANDAHTRYRPEPGACRPRDDIPARYTGISAICATGTTGPELREARCRDHRLHAIQGTLAPGPRRCLSAFTAMDEMGALSYRVWYFASLHYDQDQRDNEINARRQQVQILFARQQQASSWFNPSCWRFRSRRFAAGWTRNADLAVYRFAIESLFHEQEHVLDEAGERLLSYSGRFNSVPHDSYAALTTADMKFPSITLTHRRTR